MTSARLQEHYDDKHPREFTIDEEPAKLSSTPNNRVEAALAALAANLNGGSVLEIGAGEGMLPRSLIASGVPFSSYTLSDLSKKRAQAASLATNDARVTSIVLDIEGPEEKPEQATYDAIVMVALIEHLIDPIRAMKTVRELLRPGGFVYIDTPNIAKYTRRMKLLFGRFPSTASKDEGLRTYGGGEVDLHDEGHLHYFTFRSLELMLTRYCGFSQVQRTPYWYSKSGASNRLTQWSANALPGLFSEVAIIAR